MMTEISFFWWTIPLIALHHKSTVRMEIQLQYKILIILISRLQIKYHTNNIASLKKALTKLYYAVSFLYIFSVHPQPVEVASLRCNVTLIGL